MDDGVNEQGKTKTLKQETNWKTLSSKPCISEGISGITKTEFCFGFFYYVKQLLFQHIWSKKVLHHYGDG